MTIDIDANRQRKLPPTRAEFAAILDELDKLRAQNADLTNRLHRADADNASHAKAVTAWANQVDRLKTLAAAVAQWHRDDEYTLTGGYPAGEKLHAAFLTYRAESTAQKAEAATDTYLIWSHHHDAWWGPDRSGYTVNLADAGHYTLADAQAETRRGCYCCQVPEVPIPLPTPDRMTAAVIGDLVDAATKAAIDAGNANPHFGKAEVAR